MMGYSTWISGLCGLNAGADDDDAYIDSVRARRLLMFTSVILHVVSCTYVLMCSVKSVSRVGDHECVLGAVFLCS